MEPLKQNFTGISFLHCTFVILFAAMLLTSVASAIIVEENVQITNGTNQGAPSWSSDARKIVFSFDQGIWVMDADGSNQKKVFDSVIWDGEPCFNDNGSKIYFASESVSSSYSKFISINVMDADGSDRVQLTSGADMRSPAMSPDGTTIVYISKLSGNYDIWTMDIDGSNNVRLTDAPADEDDPAWSPDGKSIVYSSSEGSIWTTDRDGIHIEQLIDNEFNNSDPFFSPDGSKIVFASDRSGNSDIWLMNSNGTGALQITSDVSEQINPAWAPDGKKIVYVSNEDGNYNLWVMSLGNTDSQIEYTPSEDVDADADADADSAIEEILKNNSTFVIALIIIVSLLLVVIIVKLFIRSL